MNTETIHKECNRVFGCEIKTKNRNEVSIKGRAAFYWLCRKQNPKITLTELGNLMGRDHVTSRHALIKVEETYLMDPFFRAKIKQLRESLDWVIELPKIGNEEIQIQYLTSRVRDLEKEVERLKEHKYDTDFKKMLAQIPIEKLEIFKTTRLIPFLKMNGCKQKEAH